jgi:hypothetical protein
LDIFLHNTWIVLFWSFDLEYRFEDSWDEIQNRTNNALERFGGS